MRTQLKLDILKHCKQDATIFPLIDLSLYNPDIVTENAYLEVTVPGFSYAVEVPYLVGGVTMLTTQSLRLSSSITELPAGLYVVVQTIKPNDKLRETHYLYNTIPYRIELAKRVKQAVRDGEDMKKLYELTAGLDLVEMLAKQSCCAEAAKLFNLIANELETCAECVSNKKRW